MPYHVTPVHTIRAIPQPCYTERYVPYHSRVTLKSALLCGVVFCVVYHSLRYAALRYLTLPYTLPRIDLSCVCLSRLTLPCALSLPCLILVLPYLINSAMPHHRTAPCCTDSRRAGRYPVSVCIERRRGGRDLARRRAARARADSCLRSDTGTARRSLRRVGRTARGTRHGNRSPDRAADGGGEGIDCGGVRWPRL